MSDKPPSAPDLFRDAVSRVATSLGLSLARSRPQDDRFLVTMPTFEITVSNLREFVLAPMGRCAELVLRELEHARRQLFASTIGHITKHDAEPLDRLRQIEEVAADVIAEFPEERDTVARATLRHLIRAKPGGLTWRPVRRDGKWVLR